MISYDDNFEVLFVRQEQMAGQVMMKITPGVLLHLVTRGALPGGFKLSIFSPKAFTLNILTKRSQISRFANGK